MADIEHIISPYDLPSFWIDVSVFSAYFIISMWVLSFRLKFSLEISATIMIALFDICFASRFIGSVIQAVTTDYFTNPEGD
jgi:hypothetical protein